MKRRARESAGEKIEEARSKRSYRGRPSSQSMPSTHDDNKVVSVRKRSRSEASLSEKSNNMTVRKCWQTPKIEVTPSNVENWTPRQLLSSGSVSSDEDDDIVFTGRLRPRKPRVLDSNDEQEDFKVEVPSSQRGRPSKSAWDLDDEEVYSTPRGRHPKVQSLVDKKTGDLTDTLLCDSAFAEREEDPPDLDRIRELFPKGTVLMNTWIIIEEIRLERYNCMSYMLLDEKSNGAILRVYPASYLTEVATELQFLSAMLKQGHASLFTTVLHLQSVAFGDFPAIFTITPLRIGQTLHEVLYDLLYPRDPDLDPIVWNTIMQFLLAAFECVEKICKAGYILRRINMDMFAWDEKSRQVYMRNTSDVVANYERLGMKSSSVITDGNSLTYVGLPYYAPRDSHVDPNTHLTEVHCLESFLYFTLDVLGLLPWKGVDPSEMGLMKNSFEETYLSKTMKSPKTPDDEELEIPHAFAVYWLELKRGALVDICRAPTMSNGLLRLRSGRQHTVETGPNRTEPVCSMINYPKLAQCIKAAIQSNFDISSKPLLSFEEPLDKSEFSPIYCQYHSLVAEESALENELARLEIQSKMRSEHESQMEAEQVQNELFISAYIQQELRDVISRKESSNHYDTKESSDHSCTSLHADKSTQ